MLYVGVLAGMYQAQSGTVSIGEQDPTTAKRAGVTAFVDSFGEQERKYATSEGCPVRGLASYMCLQIDGTVYFQTIKCSNKKLARNLIR